MRRAAVAVAVVAILAALAVPAVELARPTSPAGAQAPSAADPAQIVRIHNGVYLYWHEPASGGGITGYDVQHRSGTSGAWGAWTDVSFSGAAQPAVVTGLAAGTTYQFRVRAENAGGKGAWSEAPGSDDDPARVVTVAASATGVPNTVRSLAAEAGEARITVTWTAPHARAGVTISGYTVFWRYYDEDDNSHVDSAPSIAAAASSHTISGLAGGRAYDVWVRAQAAGKASRDSMLVYDVTPRGGGPAATPTPTPTPTPTATPTPKPEPRVLGSIAARGGGAVTVAPGATLRLDLDLFDRDGKAVSADALPRAPVIGWYIPLDVYAGARQDEARVRVVFEGSLPDRHPTAPLASVAGAPGSALYSAPADASGRVVVRAVTAAADCPGGGGGTDSNAAAAWDGPCAAEFTITVPPAVAIAAAAESVSEGERAAFTVSRTGGTASALTVSVSVSETGDTLAGTPPASVTIPAGASTATLGVPTEDDAVRETDSVVTAMLTAPAGHVAGASGSATVTVEDDDAPAPSGLRYDAYDSTGAVTRPGSYAFLAESGDGSGAREVVTTYEGIREDASMLRVHLHDAGGISRAGSYRKVRAGDLLEWRRAADCFTRYTVTSAPAPAAGAAHREFGVEWMTYAFTGCSGTVSATASASITSGDLPDLGGTSLTAPVVHGIYQLVPLNWQGEVKPRLHRRLPGGAVSSQFFAENPTSEAAQQLPYWRDPDLPEGWTLVSVSTGYETDPPLGYTAIYAPPNAPLGLEVAGYFPTTPGATGKAATMIPGGVRETRVVDGRPMIAGYSPPGEGHSSTYASTVWIYDPATDSAYRLRAYAGAVRHIDVLIEIARSLFTEGGDSE